MGRADERLGVISRREFLRAGAASGIALTLTRLALAEEPGFAARETLPGRQRWNPAASGRGRIDAVAQGHRSQALRVRFSRCRSPGLAAEHLARDADPHRGCDPRFDWN